MKINNSKGISLLVLVITIIVVIILATAVILTLNNSGIINKAEEAAVLTEIGNIEDSASLIYMDMLSEKYTNGGKNPEFANIVNELVKMGHKIETVVSNGANVVDILLDKESITMSPNDTGAINVTLKTDTSSDVYYANIRGKYYKLIKVNGGVKVERTQSNIEFDNTETLEIMAELTSGNTVTIGGINGNEILINSNEIQGGSIVTVKYGSFSKTCEIYVVLKPNENSVPTNTEPSFNTGYGRIEVIWLDTNNNIKEAPNEPNLYSGGNALKPVTWTKSGTTWIEDKVAQSNWYNYTSATDFNDYLESQWANAKNSDGSYFVWIPRYAYRIVYYRDDTSETPLGYYDGDGLWDAKDATLSYSLDVGIETVSHNGYKYIVHPAFETNLDTGGWDKDLTGIWVAKYEMSVNGATLDDDKRDVENKTFRSLPSVKVAKNICIGDMYQYSRKYDIAKESHMIKNSEWGAVAYLAQSKYGRNGHELDINNCLYITGNGAGKVSGSNITTAYEIVNAYDTETGAKSSTTGNIYGVYDMSGGGMEYTAMYNTLGDPSYLDEIEYGLNMTKDAKDLNGNYISTKYITKYVNVTEENNNMETLRKLSKIGDCMKEVRKNRQVYQEYRSWYNDFSTFINTKGPFLTFGGGAGNKEAAGMFGLRATYGDYDTVSYSFRVVLAN